MPTADERLGNPPVDILWILAHPDDESFGSAGTMAWARNSGLRTAYVCATRGESGQIREPHLATRESLGAVREQELRTAMAVVGLSELRMLGFRDSGMENTDTNNDPRALVQQPPEEILVHLVGHIRDLRPSTVVTFGAEGIYGHPDHVMIGKIAARAVELASDESWLPELQEPWRAGALYAAAAPRERLEAIAARPDSPFGEISDASRRNLGTPSAEITHWLDVSPWLELKRAALAAHRTQIDAEAVIRSEPTEEERLRYSFEQYQRRPLPWDPGMDLEDTLDRARNEIGAAEIPLA